MRLALLSLALFTFASSLGCRPDATGDLAAGDSSGMPAEATHSASEVPLRIWIVAPVADEVLVQRKWLADSDQPIRIRTLKATELLAMERANCDVLLYPARLLGEVAEREWIVKLPTGLSEAGPADEFSSGGTAAGDASGSSGGGYPAAWKAQAAYGGIAYARPLGCSLPVVYANDALAEKLPDDGRAMAWNELLSLLPESELNAFQVDQSDAEVIDAVVDRFLTILSSVSEKNTKYGLLFELQTMQANLTTPEFVRAAELLQRLAAQSPEGSTVLGSNSAAWTAALESTEPQLVIASPSRLDSDARKLKGGAAVELAAASPRAVQAGWNVGDGLLASIAFDCSQSSQSIEFVKWLSESSSREFLSPLIPGIDAASPVSGIDAASWKALSSSRRLLGDPGLPQEPRMPGATSYREALGEELLRFLSGQVDAQAALSSAAQRWQQITEQASDNPQSQYERSLGLTL